MARFHFHIEDGQSFPDRVGTELPDVAAARREAIQLAGRLLHDNPEEFWAMRKWRIVVTDADHRELFVLAFTACDGADHGETISAAND